MDALNALAAELAMEASSALVSENKGFETSDNQSNGVTFHRLHLRGFTKRLAKPIAQFGFKNSFAYASQLDSDAISHMRSLGLKALLTTGRDVSVSVRQKRNLNSRR